MSRQENDTIYRQETTKHLKHRLYETAANNPDLGGVFSEIADNRVETWINELPTAERKKGKWQWSEEMGCFICSECKSGWKEQPTLMGKPLYDWCPVCGAMMEGVE